jgi:hypothetical protein
MRYVISHHSAPWDWTETEHSDTSPGLPSLKGALIEIALSLTAMLGLVAGAASLVRWLAS